MISDGTKEKRKPREKKPGRMRRITVRVGEVIGCPKADFYKAVRETLRLSRQVINLCFTELRARDPLQPGTFLADPYLYPVVKHLNEGGFAKQICALSSQCQRKYLQKRFEYMNGKSTIGACRNPVWPLLHNKSSKTMRIVDQGEFLTCAVSLVGGWFEFRIRSGSNYRDQIRGLRAAMEGGWICDSQLRDEGKNGVVIDVAVRLPVVEKRAGETARVYTSCDSLLSISRPRMKRPWIFTATKAVELHGKHAAIMYRLRRERKFGDGKKWVQDRIDRQCKTNADRVKDVIGVVTVKVVDYCRRNGIGRIEYDDVVKSAVPSFPWFQMKETLKYKAEDAGIEFVDVSAKESKKVVDLTKPHVYFCFDPNSERVKIGRSEDFGRRLKTFLTTNPDWVCLAAENYPKGGEVAGENHYLARFDCARVVDRGKSGHEVREAGPILEFLREARWLGNTGNRSQLMQVSFIERFMNEAGHLWADGDDQSGDVAG